MAQKAKTQQKRWHLDGGIEVTQVQEGDSGKSVTTYLGNYNGSSEATLALVAYTGSYYDLVDYPDLSNFVVDGAYVHTDNNFTTEEKDKLRGLRNYVLPIATDEILGGIKVGDHLEMRQYVDKNGKKSGEYDRLSVIESHFIQVKSGSATKNSDIPLDAAGAITLRDNASPIGESVRGYYIRYNDMAFFSQDPVVETKEFNGKTVKIEQDYMSQGGLWWTTKNAGRWIKVLDQFNIISFNDRVGKVYPVGMDDYKVDAEDYTADMVGAIARRGEGGSWTVIKDKEGKRILHQFWNGTTIKGLDGDSGGWARMGAMGWDAEKEQLTPDPVNSPTGGVITGLYWRYTGLPTLPEVRDDKGNVVTPPTYRGLNNSAFFFIPDGQDRIWVKRSSKAEDDKAAFTDNDWFYLEQLPIATRTRLGGIIVGDTLNITEAGLLNVRPATTSRLGGVIVGNGLQITESGVLSVTGIVTTWTGAQGATRDGDVIAMQGDYTASMITYNQTTVAAELAELLRLINLKAPINSPIFTGTPQTPTPPQSSNESSKKIANTQWVSWYVNNALQSVVGYTLPKATTSTLGGIIVGDGLTIDGSGRLSVNIPSGSGNIVVDTALSTSSTNPVENRVIATAINSINNNLNNNYVLKVDGTAQNISLTGMPVAPTASKGTNTTQVATTAFVMREVSDLRQAIEQAASSGGITINPYVLPMANDTNLGGVIVKGDKGIVIKSNGAIEIDPDYLNDNLDYIISKSVIGTQNAGAEWGDIPPDSSGYVYLAAGYSPTYKVTEGYYLKYNMNGNPDSYIMWFCDAQDNIAYYLLHLSANEHGWSRTVTINEGDGGFDFDLSLYAKLNGENGVGPNFTGSPTAPTLTFGSSGSIGDFLATTQYVETAINQKLKDQDKASESVWGIVRIGNGIAVTSDGTISMDGVYSFTGRRGGARRGEVVASQGDYNASDIIYGSAYVSNALDELFRDKADLVSPNFSGVPTIAGTRIATVSFVTNSINDYKPIASSSELGMIKVGNGLSIEADGTLSTSGAVTSWNTRTGDVFPELGDYRADQIHYDGDYESNNKTVKSELDLKAYDDQVWHREQKTVGINSWQSESSYTAGNTQLEAISGESTYDCAYAMFGSKYRRSTLLFRNSQIQGTYSFRVRAYIAGSYPVSAGTTGAYERWISPIKLLDETDLVSTKFTGTPTINGVPIQTTVVAGTNLGLVKNGGDIVIDSDGKMNLPIASATVLGGVKVGSGIAVDANGVISTSGAVTSFGPDGNKRSGDIVPASGDYDASQITYTTNHNVGSALDDLLNGNNPIATKDSKGFVSIGDGLSVTESGKASATFVGYENLNPSNYDLYGPHNTHNSDRYKTDYDNIWDRGHRLNAYQSGSNTWFDKEFSAIYGNIQLGNSAGVTNIIVRGDTTYNQNIGAHIKPPAIDYDLAFDQGGYQQKTITATYFKVSSKPEMQIISSNSYGYASKYMLIIASFFDNETKIPGVYYSRSDGTLNHPSYDKYGAWIKLIDTENISDYIPDTSSFYNTENYTDAEISDEITATLAELNA